jgi:hypothetical protein
VQVKPPSITDLSKAGLLTTAITKVYTTCVERALKAGRRRGKNYQCLASFLSMAVCMFLVAAAVIYTYQAGGCTSEMGAQLGAGSGSPDSPTSECHVPDVAMKVAAAWPYVISSLLTSWVAVSGVLTPVALYLPARLLLGKYVGTTATLKTSKANPDEVAEGALPQSEQGSDTGGTRSAAVAHTREEVEAPKAARAALPPAAPVAQSSTTPQMFPVQVPTGMVAGQQMVVTVPHSGQQVIIVIPNGYGPGSTFQVRA